MEGTEVRKLAALEERHWWYAERRRLLRALVRGAFSGVPDVVALDIGAAGGGNTRVLREEGCFSVPIEYGADGAEVALSRGLPAVRGDARRLPFATASAHVVVAFDVLEHIEDDRAALAEFHRVLRPGGAMWVAVPCDMRLWSEHDHAVGHVRRYSDAELLDRVQAAGFEELDLRNWNVLLRPVVRVRRRRSRGSDLAEVGWLTNWTLARVIALERHLPFLRRRAGVSLILTARRNLSPSTDSRASSP